MTATVETAVGEHFTIIEAKLNVKFRNICNRHFHRTAHYRDIKSNTHLAALYKSFFKKYSP